MSKPELTDLQVTIINETDAAWLVKPIDGKKFWAPKSLCEMEEGRLNKWTLTLPVWLLEQKQ